MYTDSQMTCFPFIRIQNTAFLPTLSPEDRIYPVHLLAKLCATLEKPRMPLCNIIHLILHI